MRSQRGCHAGVDEAGRGPLAGPVIAAAVILNPSVKIPGLDDSKKLSVARREFLEKEIQQHAVAWAIGRAEVHEIDSINILQASLLAMCRALDALAKTPDFVLVDGNKAPPCNYSLYPVIKGDQIVEAISAASILAKQTRDRELQALHKQYPEYGFEKHKGYPTKMHIEALEKYGICQAHRLSYAPVKRILEEFKK
ncbi:MAG TPA: ribonuclease HII [Gammaproteobacteria bacterium]|nr:ribonuclease HII [Gammaproteobacteria bacterium]